MGVDLLELAFVFYCHFCSLSFEVEGRIACRFVILLMRFSNDGRTKCTIGPLDAILTRVLDFQRVHGAYGYEGLRQYSHTLGFVSGKLLPPNTGTQWGALRP